MAKETFPAVSLAPTASQASAMHFNRFDPKQLASLARIKAGLGDVSLVHVSPFNHHGLVSDYTVGHGTVCTFADHAGIPWVMVAISDMKDEGFAAVSPMIETGRRGGSNTVVGKTANYVYKRLLEIKAADKIKGAHEDLIKKDALRLAERLGAGALRNGGRQYNDEVRLSFEQEEELMNLFSEATDIHTSPLRSLANELSNKKAARIKKLEKTFAKLDALCNEPKVLMQYIPFLKQYTVGRVQFSFDRNKPTGRLMAKAASTFGVYPSMEAVPADIISETFMTAAMIKSRHTSNNTTTTDVSRLFSDQLGGIGEYSKDLNLFEIEDSHYMYGRRGSEWYHPLFSMGKAAFTVQSLTFL